MHSNKKRRSNADASNLQLDRLLDVPLKLCVELGRTRMPIADLVRLGPGAMVELNRLAGEPLDITVNGKLVAHGEAVVVNGRLGVRITEVLSLDEATADSLNKSA